MCAEKKKSSRMFIILCMVVVFVFSKCYFLETQMSSSYCFVLCSVNEYGCAATFLPYLMVALIFWAFTHLVTEDDGIETTVCPRYSHAALETFFYTQDVTPPVHCLFHALITFGFFCLSCGVPV